MVYSKEYSPLCPLDGKLVESHSQYSCCEEQKNICPLSGTKFRFLPRANHSLVMILTDQSSFIKMN
jgi:hypothetical protein